MRVYAKKITVILLSAMFIFTLAACSDGPAEDAGEKVDQTVERLGNAVEDACENVKEGAGAKNKDC